jgi:predicted DNA-binding transcriptional regulator AlpA
MPLSLSVDPASMARFLDFFREALEPMIAKAVRQDRATQNPPEQAAAPPPPNSSVATGVDLKPADQLKAADLRVAFLTGRIPEGSGLLVDAKTFASLLSISTSTLYRLQAEEAILAPVRLGHLKKWRLSEILEWIEADCPPQRIWVHKRQDSSRRSG